MYMFMLLHPKISALKSRALQNSVDRSMSGFGGRGTACVPRPRGGSGRSPSRSAATPHERCWQQEQKTCARSLGAEVTLPEVLVPRVCRWAPEAGSPLLSCNDGSVVNVPLFEG